MVSANENDYQQYQRIKKNADNVSVQAAIMFLLDRLWNTPGYTRAVDVVGDVFPHVYRVWLEYMRNGTK